MKVLPTISSTIDTAVWSEPLSQFARVSGLTLSLYAPDGTLILSHVAGQSFGSMLKDAGFFDAGQGRELEVALVAEASASGREISRLFIDTLPVFAFPLVESDRVVGVVVAGWAFESFPNPVECARLARLANLPENLLWLAARENGPVGGEKLLAFLSLLKTWNLAIVNQLISLKEAREVSRLKDQFLATASHELRTPLTSILLRLQTLRRHDALIPTNTLRALEAIERAAKIQSRLVDDLLETSRLMTGKLNLAQEEFSPSALVQEAFETCAPAAEAKAIRFTVAYAKATARYVGDAMRVQQVFWNLVNNAIKFTPDGGEVKLRTREDGGRFVFEITDNGRGLSDDEIRHLFKPFYQANATKHGMNTGLGLGLSIAKTIVELHQGTIRAVSGGHGQGATFQVSLPAAEAASGLAGSF